MTESDTVTLDIEGPDGAVEVTLPEAVLDKIAGDDQPFAEVVGDLAMFGCAQRIHATVHHAQGDVEADLEAAEALTMTLFEERFGETFGEVTGHQH